MVFGNTSLHADVVLLDVDIPAELAAAFGGPRHGIDGLRRRVGAFGRALTCSALKPQGVPPARLAQLAEQFARGGIDFIKDDHGLADQAYSPFAERVAARDRRAASATHALCAQPVRRSRCDAPPDRHRAHARHRHSHGRADDRGLGDGRRPWCGEYPDVAFFAHPTMGGAARIAPDLLIGKLFRLLGADAVIFPNHGGRFGYTPETCRRLADQARAGVGRHSPQRAGARRRHDAGARARDA